MFALVSSQHKICGHKTFELPSNLILCNYNFAGELLQSDTNVKKLFKDKHIQEDKYPKLFARRARKIEENRVLSEEEKESIMTERLKKIEIQNKRLAEMGINYQFSVGEKVKSKFLQNDTTESKPVEPAVTSKSPKNEVKVKTPQSKEQERRSSIGSAITTPGKRKKSLEVPHAQMSSSNPVKQQKRKSDEMEADKTPPIKKKKSLEMPKMSTPSPFKTNKGSDAMKEITPDERKSVEFQKEAQLPSPAKVKKNKSPALPRISPKLLRSKSKTTQQAHAPPPEKLETKNIVSKGKKVVSSDLPNTSPKALRSKQEPITTDTTTTPKGKKKDKSPALSKISPKMLRSRKSQGPSATAPLPSPATSGGLKGTPGKRGKQTPDLPKISPKMLRSRKSEVPIITAKEKDIKPAAAKGKKPGRKSTL